MAEIKGSYQPEFSLSSEGQKVSFSRLRFVSSKLGVKVVIESPDDKTLKINQIVTGELKFSKDITGVKLFTCVVVDVFPGRNQIKIYTCKDPYLQMLQEEVKAVSFRKAGFKEITEAILEACGVEKFDLSKCPAGELSRFSLSDTTGFRAIGELFRAWKLKTREELIYLPGVSGEIKIGVIEDIVSVYPFVHNLETGKNIISRVGRWITGFALPVLYGQNIYINGIDHICNCSILTIAAGTYRIELEVFPV